MRPDSIYRRRLVAGIGGITIPGITQADELAKLDLSQAKNLSVDNFSPDLAKISDRESADIQDWTETFKIGLDYCAPRGVALFLPSRRYLLRPLTLPPKAIVLGESRYRTGGAILYLLARNGAGITIPSDSYGCRLDGLQLFGRLNNSPQAETAIECHGDSCVIQNIRVDNFKGAGIILGGVASSLRDCFIQNVCLKDNNLDASNKTYFGAVEIGGSDHFIENIEALAGGSGNPVLSANRNRCALLLKGTSCFISCCVFEISDTGLVVVGHANRIHSCRADKNYGTGFHIRGTKNQLMNCSSYDNSIYHMPDLHIQHGVDPKGLRGYGMADGFNLGGEHNLLIGCTDFGENINRTRYGFYVASPGNNVISSCMADGNAKGKIGGILTGGAKQQVF